VLKRFLVPEIKILLVDFGTFSRPNVKLKIGFNLENV